MFSWTMNIRTQWDANGLINRWAPWKKCRVETDPKFVIFSNNLTLEGLST